MMQKIIIMMGLALFPLPMAADFAEANRAYQQGNFKEALALYEKIPNKGMAVWYNMGNASYRLGNNLYALLYWRFAQWYKDNPALLKDVHHNLEIIASRHPEVIADEHAYKEIIEQWNALSTQARFGISWSLLTRQTMVILLCTLLVVIFLWCTAWYRWLLMVIMTLLIGASVGLWLVKYRQLTDVVGLVKQKNVTVYAGPDNKYHVLGTVNEFSFVNVYTLYNGWAKIKLLEKDKLMGWIGQDALVIK